jgi:transcription factor 1
LTRALLKLPHSRVQKIIVLEDHERYLEYLSVCSRLIGNTHTHILQPLEKVDPRIHVVPIPGFSWDAYVTIQDMGLLDDVKTVPWTSGGKQNRQIDLFLYLKY